MAARGKNTTMKTLFLTTAAFVALMVAAPIGKAHATLVCDAPTQMLGKTGNNPVVSTTVIHNDAGWSVTHTLADGRLVDRSTQYTMADDSVPHHPGWHGWSTKNQHLWMTGEVFPGVDRSTYVETLNDDHRGDTVMMRSSTSCRYENPTPAHEPVIASTPAPVATAPSPGGSNAGYDDKKTLENLMGKNVPFAPLASTASVTVPAKLTGDQIEALSCFGPGYARNEAEGVRIGLISAGISLEDAVLGRSNSAAEAHAKAAIDAESNRVEQAADRGDATATNTALCAMKAIEGNELARQLRTETLDEQAQIANYALRVKALGHHQS